MTTMLPMPTHAREHKFKNESFKSTVPTRDRVGSFMRRTSWQLRELPLPFKGGKYGAYNELDELRRPSL